MRITQRVVRIRRRQLRIVKTHRQIAGEKPTPASVVGVGKFYPRDGVLALGRHMQ